MQIFSKLITFTTAPVVLSFVDSNNNPILRMMRIYAEPATSNLHDCFVESTGAAVATGATGNTMGVIKRLAKPPVVDNGTPTDFWDVAANFGSNILEVAQYQFDGTAGEKVRVTIHVQ